MRDDILKDSWLIERTPSFLALSMFYYIQSAGHYFYKSYSRTERSRFDSILLAYTVKGEGVLRYMGQEYIIRPGHTFIIDCMEPQYYAPYRSEVWEIIYIHFNGSESRKYTYNILNNCGPVFAPDRSCVPDKIREIHTLLHQNHAQADILASRMIVEILTELLLSSIHGNNGIEIVPPAVQELQQLILQQYHTRLELGDMAQKAGFSKFHLSRLFKKHTGFSPYEYLTKYRMNQAKKMLQLTGRTVCEIANLNGFESPSQFCKLFKKYENMSPLAYRRNMVQCVKNAFIE